MAIRRFATSFGVVFLLAGLAGFIPGLSPGHSHAGLNVTASSRLALGLFPVNVLHNVVHLAFGPWGLAAARSVPAALIYARAVALIYAALTIMGMIAATDTMFGLVPIYGNDIWLHALLAMGAAYFGFVRSEAHGDHVTR